VDLVNTLAQYLEFEPMEKQALLERPDPLARCRAMVELLEMRTFSHGNGDSTTVH
jgi:Lon protease-like protein